MRFFRILNDFSPDTNTYKNFIAQVFNNVKYYIQIFVLANFSLFAIKDFACRVYYFNFFSFILGYFLSKYIQLEELIQTGKLTYVKIENLLQTKGIELFNDFRNIISQPEPMIGKEILECDISPVDTNTNVEQTLSKETVTEPTPDSNLESKSISSIEETAEHTNQPEQETIEKEVSVKEFATAQRILNEQKSFSSLD
jgi:hypothetical protein